MALFDMLPGGSGRTQPTGTGMRDLMPGRFDDYGFQNGGGGQDPLGQSSFGMSGMGGEAPGSDMNLGDWGQLGVKAFGSLASAYMGMQQLDLAKQSLSENKRQFDINFGAQKKMTNSRLRDRQRARVASNPNAYQSTDSYMDKNGI